MEILEARFDSRKSFYNKAKTQTIKNSVEQVCELYSYGVLVASVIYSFINEQITYKYLGKYSQTTSRHQKEFFKQHGASDNDIKNILKNGVIIKRGF